MRRSGRLKSLKPGTPQFTFVMGLVFLLAGLVELIGVVYGAPHWGWIAVASACQRACAFGSNVQSFGVEQPLSKNS